MITIIGAGKLGSQIASKILNYKPGDITLIDMSSNRVKGEALNNIQVAFESKSNGKSTYSNNYQDMQKSDLVIIFAEQENSSVQIIKALAQQVARYAPNSILLIATNPVDIMTYVAYKATNFPRNRIIGIGSIFDSMHFRKCIAMELGVSSKDVNAMTIGEHGKTMVPLVEYASVSGIPICKLLTPEQIEKIINQTVVYTANEWSTVYSSTLSMIANAVVKGKNIVASVSTPLKGEYDCSDLSIGVPVVLGKSGIQKIIELNLPDKDRKRFENSAETVKAELCSVRFDS